MKNFKEWLGWKNISKKQKIGLLLALSYWAIIIAMAIVIHELIIIPMIENKASVGGELFLIPSILIIMYFLYDKILTKILKKYMYN